MKAIFFRVQRARLKYRTGCQDLIYGLKRNSLPVELGATTPCSALFNGHLAPLPQVSNPRRGMSSRMWTLELECLPWTPPSLSPCSFPMTTFLCSPLKPLTAASPTWRPNLLSCPFPKRPAWWPSEYPNPLLTYPPSCIIADKEGTRQMRRHPPSG
jgi:hypothetical protein